MFYFTYKTTNTINGKFYYGFHSTENLKDSYLGSGTLLKKAIKKYGRKVFVREILQYFDSFESLVEEEARLVSQEIVDDPLCYNIRCGGMGGVSPAEETLEKFRIAKRGKPHSEIHSKNISNALMGHEVTEQTKKNQSIAAKNRKKKWKTVEKGAIQVKHEVLGRKFIRPEQLEEYLNCGYVCSKRALKIIADKSDSITNSMTPQERKSYRISVKRKEMFANKPKMIRMKNSNTGKLEFVEAAKMEEYLTKGYIKNYTLGKRTS